MKTVSPALLAHMALGTTTLAWCWRVIRTDGEMFGFTTVDKALQIGDLQVAGVQLGNLRYEAATGMTPSAIEGQVGMAVPNLEMAGFLDSDSITVDDLLAGRWDDASVLIFQVNYNDLSMGAVILAAGKSGNVSSGTVGFKAEGRGLAQMMQQPVGEVYSPSCPANLGDARCGVDLGPLTETAAVTSVENLLSAFTATSLGTDDDHWGLVTWLTGANTGLSMEVANSQDGAITLHLPMPYPIAVGDTFEIIPKCHKRRTDDCSAKFDNVLNFRGFPDVPLNDKVIGQATAASID
jgi:uncharacterized phage protein (TIGR02218 family)